MRRHYIHIGPSVKDYAQQIAPGVDWASDLYEDITDHGRCLTILPLGDNARGRRVGLYGDKYYCEAGEDFNRADCLFIFRAASADRNLPSTQPFKRDAEITLLRTEKHVAALDPIAYLFDAAESDSESARLSVPQPDLPRTVLLSSQSKQLLEHVPDALRHAWRPGKATQKWTNFSEFIEAASTVWIRRRLAPFTPLRPRYESLLKGLLKPVALGAKERDQLMSMFSIEMLNAFVRHNREAPSEALDLLKDLSTLEVSAAFHASVWSAMLVGLDAAGIRRELHECCDPIDGLHADKTHLNVWEKNILDAIEAVANNNRDESLIELCDRAAGDREPLSVIAAWARRLQFQDTNAQIRLGESVQPLTAATIPDQPEIDAPLSSRAPDQPREQIGDTSRDAELDRWILRMNVTDDEHLNRIGSDIRHSCTRMGDLGVVIQSPNDVAVVVSELMSLQTKVSEWLTQLPKTSQLSLDYKECSDALHRARSVLGNSIGPYIEELRITPSDLNRSLDLYERAEALSAMPEWISKLWSMRDQKERTS